MTMMHSKTSWIFSKRPNYEVNINKLYPYSEVPYIGQYNLVKIPTEDQLVDLVDYWGEGRIIAEEGNTGFSDCYNVNHEYQQVSNGKDRSSKIPNRIPVISYTDCDTSSYIKDNSVKTVTLMGSPINKSCAADIARIVNIEAGTVIVYGFNGNETDVKNLEEALNKRGFTHCPDLELSDMFKTMTLFDVSRSYLNADDINKELYKSVGSKLFEKAVKITKNLNKNISNGEISKVVLRLIEEGKNEDVIKFGEELVNKDGQDIIDKHFPDDVKERIKATASVVG